MTAAGTLAGVRCVVAGGSGAVGRLFVDAFLAAGADVCIVDARPPQPAGWRCSFECADITAVGPRLEAELRRADVVLLALPEPVAVAALPGVARAMAPGALLADTLSVKHAIAEQLRRHAGHLQALSLNPMFAPSLGLEGRVVAATVVHDGPRVEQVLEVVRERRGRVLAVSAERHDELAAVTQALTHAAVLAFGLALAELEVEIDETAQIAPPPHLALLALVARILGGEPETYWDVQASNPHAERARTALASGLQRLAAAVASGEPAQFTALLGSIADGLGDDAEHFREVCHAMFEPARPPDRSTQPPILAGTAGSVTKGLPT